MFTVLVPVDGSANALRAVQHAIAAYRRDQGTAPTRSAARRRAWARTTS